MLDDSWLRFGDITIFKWWLITMLNFQKFTVKITCAVSGYNTLAILHWSTGCCSPPPRFWLHTRIVAWAKNLQLALPL